MGRDGNGARRKEVIAKEKEIEGGVKKMILNNNACKANNLSIGNLLSIFCFVGGVEEMQKYRCMVLFWIWMIITDCRSLDNRVDYLMPNIPYSLIPHPLSHIDQSINRKERKKEGQSKN